MVTEHLATSNMHLKKETSLGLAKRNNSPSFKRGDEVKKLTNEKRGLKAVQVNLWKHFR